MTEYSLVPHPDFPSSAVTSIVVHAARADDTLRIAYRAGGELDQVCWPEPTVDVRADELWRHTCFEAFVQGDSQNGYIELNLSPSGSWAAYQFDGRRSGMRDADVTLRSDWASPALTACIALPITVDWRLGLTAVIEAADGTKSYWALAHAPGPPDFHNPDCFIATLPAPAAR